MSSAPQFILPILQQNDYVTLAILTAVGYDYVLTFSNEVEYIWTKPWTLVSTLFVLVRYCGLYCLIISTLIGSSFLPGPAKTCKTIIAIRGWVFPLFLGAADLVMILRVWAMYGRSKLVLGVLLASFFLEIVSLVLTAAIQSDPRNLSAATIHILDFTGCTVDPTSFIWGKINSVLQITHGTAMLAFAIVKFAQQSLETYRLTRQWHLNRYISMLVKQGIFYFFAVFMFNLINELAAAGILQNYGWQLIVTIILQYVPVFTLTPRFIMGIRELYAHDTGVRCSGGIDTGFGLQSYSRDADGTVMVFAGVGQDEGSGDVEEIQREIGTTLPM